MRRWLLASPIVAALLAASPARAAEGKTSSLSWVRLAGADSCVATQPLARAVEERLHRPVFVSAAQADLSVEGRIEKRRGGGWRAVVTVRDEHGATLGTRELERPDGTCDAMTDPLVLAIALMIDPDAAMRPRAATSEEPKPAPKAANDEAKPAPVLVVPVPDAPAAPAPPPPHAVPWRFDGEAQATVNYGLGPEVTPGAGVEAILYPPSIPVGMRGYATLFLPASVEKDAARASLDMLYMGGALCPTVERRARLMGCIGGQLGVLRPRAETSGRGITEDLQPILNAVIEARAHVPIAGPFGFAGGIGAGVPLLRPEVDFRRTTGATDELHRTKAFVLSADLGVGLFFP